MWLVGELIQRNTRSPRALADPSEGNSRRDFLQPGAERTTFLVTAQQLRESDEDVVDDIFRVVGGLQETERYRQQLVGVPIVQLAQCLRATVASSGDQVTFALYPPGIPLCSRRGHDNTMADSAGTLHTPSGLSIFNGRIAFAN